MKIITTGKKKKNNWLFFIIAIILIVIVVYAIKGLLFVTAIIDQSNENGEFTYLRLNEDLLLVATNGGEYRPIYSVANAYIYQLPQGLIYTYHCSDGIPRQITAKGEITYVQVMDFNQKVYYQEETVC